MTAIIHIFVYWISKVTYHKYVHVNGALKTLSRTMHCAYCYYIIIHMCWSCIMSITWLFFLYWFCHAVLLITKQQSIAIRVLTATGSSLVSQF